MSLVIDLTFIRAQTDIIAFNQEKIRKKVFWDNIDKDDYIDNEDNIDYIPKNSK
jgi:hypothetical protein